MFKKIIPFFFLISSLALADSRPSFDVRKSLANGTSMPFIAHQGTGNFDNYLALNLPAQDARELGTKIEHWTSLQLKSRGEAHITVISPVEFQKIQRLVSIQEINDIASRANMQKSAVEIRCLGRGKLVIDRKEEIVYFVVVKSPELIAIRGQISALFQGKGGSANEFNPDLFYPHITIGFTKRDLHYEDGVIKNEASCVADLKIANPK